MRKIVPRLIHQEVSDFFQDRWPATAADLFITFTEVIVAPDLRQLTVYVSFLPRKGAVADLEKKVAGLLEYMEDSVGELKQYLASSLRRKLRRSPTDIRFLWDKGGHKASGVHQVLGKHKDERGDDLQE